MGLRLYRRVRIAPGFTLNLGKRGASLSMGRRGYHYTLGSRASRATVGMPGRGVSYTTTSSRAPTQRQQRANRPLSIWQTIVACFGLLVILTMLGANGEWVSWLVLSIGVAGFIGSRLPPRPPKA
jgi:hypothetical protein